MAENERRLLTVIEAAAKARVSKSLVYELCRTARLKHFRIGVRGRGKILIDRDDLDALLASCRIAELTISDEELNHIR
jgi:excisionase family DNA binding protein